MVGVTAGTPPHPDVPPTLTLQKQSRLPAATAPEEVLAGGACVGADCLLRVLANYSRSGEVKTTITVGVVGELGGLQDGAGAGFGDTVLIATPPASQGTPTWARAASSTA